MKLLITENAITDLRNYLKSVQFSDDLDNTHTGYYKRKYHPGYGYNRGYDTRGDFEASNTTRREALVKWLEDILRNKWDFDFNTEQLNLIKVNKPKGPTVAKKNENMLIGIDTTTGNTVLIGNGKFYTYYSGKMGYSMKTQDWGSATAPDNPEPDWEYKHRRVSLRDLYDSLDLWLEIVPKEGYMPRSKVRTPTDITKYSDDVYTNKKIYRSEIDLYDVERARQNYARRVKSVKTRREYADLLNSIDGINERINNIDFGHPIFDDRTFSQNDIVALKNEYKSLVSHINTLNKAIDKNDRYDLKYYPDYIRKNLEVLDNILTNRFDV